MQTSQNGQQAQQNPQAITDAAPPSDRGLAQYQPPPEEAIMLGFDSGQKYVRTSYEVTSEEGVATVSRLLVKADRDITEVYGHDLEVIGYLYHPVQLADEVTGEVRWMGRLALHLADGGTVDTCSQSAIQAFAFLASTRGASPWEKPLKIHVDKRKGRQSGHDYAVIWAVAPKRVEKKK